MTNGPKLKSETTSIPRYKVPYGTQNVSTANVMQIEMASQKRMSEIALEGTKLVSADGDFSFLRKCSRH